jgi:hypothetical protein
MVHFGDHRSIYRVSIMREAKNDSSQNSKIGGSGVMKATRVGAGCANALTSVNASTCSG